MKKLLVTIVVLLTLLLSAQAFSQATLYTTNVQGSTNTPGATFTVDVAVAANSQGPVLSYFFRVNYDSDSMSLISVQDVDLGGYAPDLGPVSGSGVNTFRNVSTLGNIANTLNNLTLCRLTFLVGPAPNPSKSVLITTAPGQIPLIDDNINSIPIIIDNTETTDFPAIVYTSNLVGNPYQPNSTFTVDLRLIDNTTTPLLSYFFRVYYDSNSVSLQSVQDVNLGGQLPVMGPVQGSGANTYRVVSTLGNANNTLYNLTMCRLVFKVSATPAASYSILVQDDPLNVALVGLDGISMLNIKHRYDLSATNPIPVTPVPPSATVYTTNVQGSIFDPAAPQTFTVDVAVSNNTVAPVQSYYFRVNYDSTLVNLVGIQDVQLGGPAPEMGPVEGSGATTFRNIASLGNISNPIYNPTLCRLTFEAVNPITADINISISDRPFFLGLVDTLFNELNHTYNNAETTPVTLNELTVTSAYDSPVPAGTSDIVYNSVVNASITNTIESISADTRARCNGRTGTGSATSGPETSFSFSIIQDSTITWNWINQYLLTTNVSPAAGGTITLGDGVTPAQGWYDDGTSITVMAQPAAGYYFVEWQGDLTGSNALQSFAISAPTDVTAVFALLVPTPSPSATPSPTPTPITNPALVSTSLNGNATTPGSTFTVDVAVSANEFGPVGGYGFIVTYDSNSVTLLSAADASLGAAPSLGPITGSGASTFRAISTTGNAANTLNNLTIFTLTFQVTASPVTYSIEIADDPNSSTPLFDTASDPILHTFDNAATQNIPAISQPAIIDYNTIQGNAGKAGQTFTIDVAIRDNIQAPVAQYAFNVAYNANSVTLNSATAVDFTGAPVLGPVTGAGASTSRSITTLGDPANAVQNLTLVRLSFTVAASPTFPYTIQITDDTNSSIPLLGTNLSAIVHNFDPAILTIQKSPLLEEWTFDCPDPTDGWTFSGQIENFDPMTPLDTECGRIGLNPNASANSFGFWYSPDVEVEKNKTYSVLFNVSSNAITEDIVPQFRVRVAEETGTGLWRGWYTIVESFENASPLTTEKGYEVIFSPEIPVGLSGNIHLAFDLLSFNPDDQTTASVYLEYARIQEITYTVGAPVAQYALTGYQQAKDDWYAFPVLGDPRLDDNWMNNLWDTILPRFAPESEGEFANQIGINANGSGRTFGFMVAKNQLTLTPANIYRLTYNVDTSTINPPEIRLRANQAGNWRAWYTTIHATSSYRAPATDYHLFVIPQDAGTGNVDVHPAFDLLYIAPDKDNPDAEKSSTWIYLNDIDVDEVTVP